MDGGRYSVSWANAAETSLTSRNGSRLSEATHNCLIVSVFSFANCRYSISITTTTSPPTFLVFVNPAALPFRKISDASQEESHMGLIWHELFPVKGSFSESIIGRRLKDAPYCAK